MQVNSYLQKTFKGRYLEHLEYFLKSIDDDYRWVSFFFAVSGLRKRSKPRHFFVYYCRQTLSLVLIKVHMCEKPNDAFTVLDFADMPFYVTKDNVFVIEMIYSKEILIEEDSFEAFEEHFEFLF